MIDIEQLIEGKCYEKLADYSFCISAPSDIEDVREFIKTYWRADHPFAVYQELLDWQYYDKVSKRYNFVLAKLKASGEIHGIYAFIPVSQFDDALVDHKDIWLSIWKVRPDVKTPLLGLSLLSFLINDLKPRSLIGIKSSEIAKALYGGNARFKTGFLNHFYILNPQKTKFELVGNFGGMYYSEEGDRGGDTRIEALDASNLDAGALQPLFESSRVPSKSAAYVKNRFVTHPAFEYSLFTLMRSGVPSGLIVGRIEEYQGARAMRIVDYFGEEEGLAGSLDALLQLLVKHDCEYIDFYNHGFSEEKMAKVGFLNRTPDSAVVIPNYFVPFSKENVDIDYLVRSDADVVICKADADQDRPHTSTQIRS